MKVVVTFELTDAAFAADERQLRLLLRDALGEFCSQRRPVAEYVAKRHHYLPDGARGEKVLQVAWRVGLATALHDNFEVKVVPPEEVEACKCGYDDHGGAKDSPCPNCGCEPC